MRALAVKEGVRPAGTIAGLIVAISVAGCRNLPGSSRADMEGEFPPRSIAGAPTPVISVVDGDTIHVLRRGRDVRVRLIGIDAPEVGWYGGTAECFGARAGRFAKGLLGGEDVVLELDEERIDPYGRLLAYVWLDKRMANVVLVRRGFATVTVYPPNDRYEERLLAAEDAARAEGAGLWSACRSAA